MLENIGCKPNQIAKIMVCNPNNITTSVENVLQPKLQLLRESGIEEADMAKVLTLASSVLTRGLEHELIPRIKLLKSAFQSHDLFIKAVLRSPKVLTIRQEILAKSLAFWEGCGISGMNLAKFLYLNPYHLLNFSLTPAHADLIHAIGAPKGSTTYKYVLLVVMTHRTNTLELRMRNLQLCGFSTEEIMELFRVSPHIFTYSTEKVRQTMQFLINDMELPANSVLRHPLLLKKNLGSVIKPRFLVLQAIKSINGLGPYDPKRLCTILRMPEERFLCKIVKGNTEHMALYEKAIAKSQLTKRSQVAERSQ
ncbi:hypothetical protein SUGI_0200950 [Cryptomeria japonica]|nr:hypothetical protein SUGI_0200950 [Cryptomeria japonica]